MFKVLVIQAANNLSDERTEFLINDCPSFMRFLGLGLSDRVPDAHTISLFHEKQTRAEAISGLFGRFDAGSGGEPPAGGSRNGEADFRGERRSNDSHASTADPDARLYPKGRGKESKLCFMCHGLMENLSGLKVRACLTRAVGHAERTAALTMIEPQAGRDRSRWAPTRATTPRTS